MILLILLKFLELKSGVDSSIARIFSRLDIILTRFFDVGKGRIVATSDKVATLVQKDLLKRSLTLSARVVGKLERYFRKLAEGDRAERMQNGNGNVKTPQYFEEMKKVKNGNVENGNNRIDEEIPKVE